MKLSEAGELIETGLDLSTFSTWTDLGCGPGLFTKALARKLSPGSTIYAIDREEFHIESLNGVKIENISMDFVNSSLPFSSIDGIIMANSFHFVEDKVAFVKKITKILIKNGIWIMVEYDMDRANRWVPFPVSFESLKSLLDSIGHLSIKKLRSVPSIYHRGSIYSSIIQKS